MEREQFSKLMRGMQSSTHKKFDADELEFWYGVLSDVPDDALQQAFYRFVATGDDWPSIAKIRELADEQLNGQNFNAGEAFESVCGAVRRFGSYQSIEAHGQVSADRRDFPISGGQTDRLRVAPDVSARSGTNGRSS